eukprot:14640623-Alexandrium_andersonii.AAC.1
MSASLVGSEMCIRDRACGKPLEIALITARVEQAPGQAHECTCTGVHAVSYTHLTLPTICSV